MHAVVANVPINAQALARVIESEGPGTDAVTLNRVEVREVVAHL